MKFIFTILIALSALYSDEIQRLEAVVVEITQLRNSYEECKSELLTAKNRESEKTNQELNEKVKKLEKIVKRQEKLLKTKEKKEKKQQLTVDIRKKDNVFPKLVMKPEYRKEAVKEQTPVTFKPVAFHLIKDSEIYDAIDGTEIDKWEKHTSFTSGVKTKDWIKITGYFVDKKWRRAKKEMWVELKHVSKKFER